jgi:exodeoxyribonuclease VII small subunit
VNAASPSFREELERLEAIVRSLEDEDTDLDPGLALFEEGVRRLKAARKLLRAAELKVRRVLESADGTLDTADLDD